MYFEDERHSLADGAPLVLVEAKGTDQAPDAGQARSKVTPIRSSPPTTSPPTGTSSSSTTFDAVSGLLAGKATRVSALFREPEQHEQVLRRVRVIHNKAKENFEERGLETLSIGCGMATWENKRAAWQPCAPVLLQAASLRPVGVAQDEFELAVVGETMQVNPTLLHVLKVDSAVISISPR